MTLTEMRSLLAKRDIQLTRSLGQNFLHDGNQLRRIVDAAEISPTDKILEIGPGLGPLTELLLEKAGEVLAIELDARLVDFLCERFGTKKRDDNLLTAALMGSAEEKSEPNESAEFHLLHDDALAFLKREPRDWSDWKLGQPAVFRRLADSGGTRRRPARAEADRRHAATGSREAADGAGGRRRLRHSDAAGAA